MSSWITAQQAEEYLRTDNRGLTPVFRKHQPLFAVKASGGFFMSALNYEPPPITGSSRFTSNVNGLHFEYIHKPKATNEPMNSVKISAIMTPINGDEINAVMP